MKSYSHLAAKLFSTPLMLHAPVRMHFERELLMRMGYLKNGISSLVMPPAPHAALGDPGRPFQAAIERNRDVNATVAAMRLDDLCARIGPVMVVRMSGVIDKHISQADLDCYGGLDLNDVDQVLGMCAQDDTIKKIVAFIDSPGGSVVGVQETCNRLAALRATKEIHAFIGTMCCSAAFPIAMQATRVVSSPSAIIGNLGVYCAILDASAWYREEGFNPQVIYAGKWKTMGTDTRALTKDETAEIQKRVDTLHARFQGYARAFRDIPLTALEGQCFEAQETEDRNMVDDLTEQTVDEYVASLL